ncbi:DUF4179 domain-containing protein [Bacillus salacetis]|uniref:DUF4179 domain-containing protein n=1 Tax=Bacillus salacetis TaxID=2315464 RepID=A0A3A1QSM9_9BACI|nr:DUF4179 domain-containing protein [Bacillus salacetis]RIW28741.1 DUF4179 domain-containing protein [Bacillus salacetis]
MKTETESVIVQHISESSMKAVLSWFEKNKGSLYKLGWLYLKETSAIQEAFYQTILKVHEDARYIRETEEFDSWVTEKFINECRSRTSDTTIQFADIGDEVLNSLDKLPSAEKEAISLIYIKPMPVEEAAKVLKLSVHELNSRLSRGIGTLSKELNEDVVLEGCAEYKDRFIEYLGKMLNRREKIDLEIHIYHCQACRKNLSIFQEIIFSLERSMDELMIPPEFMVKVNEKVAAHERMKREKSKKRSRMGLTAAGLLTFMICTGFVTGGFTSIYYSWMGWTQQEDQEILSYYKEGISEPLNLEQESNGVKVKIKTAVADDIQTLIYYEVESMNDENQYFINMPDGARIENEYELLDQQADQLFYNPYEQGLSNDENGKVFKGKISLAPITKDSGTIELSLMRLQEAINDQENQTNFKYYQQEFVEGKWDFDIPVTKHESTVYEINKETEIEGVPFRIDKLKLAPSATILEYSFKQTQEEQMIEHVTLKALATKDKSVKADLFGGGRFVNSSGEWLSLQSKFDSLYFDRPEEVDLSFDSLNVFVEDKKSIEIKGADHFPQTFEYQGNELSIDNIVMGNPTRLYIKDEYTANRKYESIQFNVVSNEGLQSFGIGIGGEGILVDKEGNTFKPEEYPFTYDEVEQPRYFNISHEVELHHDNSDEPLTPKTLLIEGYRTTKYIEDSLKIPLD